MGRVLDIAQTDGCADNVDHGPAFQTYLAAKPGCAVDDLLYTVDIGCKCSYDQPRLCILRKYFLKFLAD